MTTTALALDYPQLRQTLPHGPGMLLLDRVEALVPGVEIRACKSVSGTEACYAGLGPEVGVVGYAYPSSLVLESFGQAAAVLWLHTAASPAGRLPVGHVLMFVAARGCTFDAPAYPGDLLRHVARLEHLSDGAAFVSGHTCVDGRQVASFGSLTAVVRPSPATPPNPKGAAGHG